MVFNIYIKNSNSKIKKYVAFIFNKRKLIKIVKFWDRGLSDYTIHNDELLKESFIARHYDYNINNFKFPAFFSRWVLFNKKSIEESIIDLNEKYNSNKIYFYRI